MNSSAASRNPATPHLYYLVDGSRHLVVLDARDGRVVRNVSYWDTYDWLSSIAVDSHGYVYLVASKCRGWLPRQSQSWIAFSSNARLVHSSVLLTVLYCSLLLRLRNVLPSEGVR